MTIPSEFLSFRKTGPFFFGGDAGKKNQSENYIESSD